MNNTVGLNLKKLRKENRWNQSTVAAKLKISIPAYSKMETGDCIINITRLKELAEVFEVPTNIILCVEAGKNDSFESAEIQELKNKISCIDQELIDLRIRAIELYDIIRDK